METKLHAALRRRRIIRWALVALFLVVVGGWTGYQTLGGANRLVSPVAGISDNPIAGGWPMLQRSPARHALGADAGPRPAG